MREKSLKEIVGKISEGVLAYTTDLCLYTIFFMGASLGKSGSRGIYQAFREADKALGEINYLTFRQALVHLKRKKLIKIKKEGRREKIVISETGQKKLHSFIPFYQKERPWDKKIYLVTYDIPIAKNRHRDILRKFLHQLGCALLQESVWLTPFNPKNALSDFVKERGLSGIVLVSDLGLDGKIGDEDLKSLLNRLYKLDEVNSSYKEFVKKYSDGKHSPLEVSFAFNKILALDPQLPFELLPSDWQGEKAYKLFLKLTRLNYV